MRRGLSDRRRVYAVKTHAVATDGCGKLVCSALSEHGTREADAGCLLYLLT